uniref:DUF642 domain-containing protein n=1 Tax=Kalanchoe fedtschenkoi TaxID=63787 RepID=A0A7N0RGZ6_KALFE
MIMMRSVIACCLLIFLVCAAAFSSFSVAIASATTTGGLLRNGNFEYGPKSSQLRGRVVTDRHAIPNWEISGYVEYIKSGQKQGDMLLVVPEGAYAVRLGNEASITQKLNLKKGGFYSITFSTARTCAQEEKLNVSVYPNSEENDWGILPVQTMYSSNGWDLYSWAFQADASVVAFTIHNPGAEEDPACGPLLDSVALKPLSIPKPTKDNVMKNGDFEEGPYVIPKTPGGVLIPPYIEDDHSPLPGWTVESLKAVKYLDSEHFYVPGGRRAVELIGGKESAITQIVRTIPGKIYVLTFKVGDGKNQCEGTLGVEAFAGKAVGKVVYVSSGKGGFKEAKVTFRADAARTRISFLSSYYTMTSDNTGSLCGPVIDDVRLVSVRNPPTSV